ncbi:hypothetical protein NDU88_004068 [Pleurodeles waltl]|uniref:Uncharacterized protein n=1 Tax=Pleurodeles waltl TaxID=8319 RepID=A0AAV7M587_PLEWA|nr:hypothetical protein NDU88_004068 [Pleurodeles waltl]
MLPFEALFRVHKTDSHQAGRKITCARLSLSKLHSRRSTYSHQTQGGGSRVAKISQAPQKARRRALMEVWWIALLALAFASRDYCAPLENQLSRDENNSIVEAVNTYKGDRNTSSVFRLLDVGTKGKQNVKNCSALISGDTVNTTVIRCDPTKPIFVNAERQKQWRENMTEERKERRYENPSGLRKNVLDKPKLNITGGSSNVACVSCVVCTITNSC